MKHGVFIERDGVLNRVRVEKGRQVSPMALSEFQVSLEAVAPLKRLKEAGLIVLATTNQPGISRGYQCRRELDRMHEVLSRRLPLDGILVCPHDEADCCPCRKPKPGLLTEAAFEWHLELDRCFVVGQRWQDAEAARNAGCTSLLLASPWNGDVHHDFILPSLADIAEKILELHSRKLGPTFHSAYA